MVFVLFIIFGSSIRFLLSIKIYKKFHFNNYKLNFLFSIKDDWINDGTYLRNVHITLLELSEFPSVVFYLVILYKIYLYINILVEILRRQKNIQ